MRVLLVTKGLDLGGIERVVTDLATGLHSDGVDVEVALVNTDRSRLVPVIEAAGVTVHRLDGTDTIGVNAARRLARLVRAGSYDVVHVHGPLPAIVARIAAAAPGARGAARVVTTSHTPWHSLRLATRTAWRATAGLDAASIAVSAAVAASLPARVGRDAVVIPHGISPARIADARHGANCDDVSERRTGVVRVVAVASHRDAKNYPNLLRGVRAALDTRCAHSARHHRRRPQPRRAHRIGRRTRHRRRRHLCAEHRRRARSDRRRRHPRRRQRLRRTTDRGRRSARPRRPRRRHRRGTGPRNGQFRCGSRRRPPRPRALGGALVELADSAELRATMSANARRQLTAWTLHDVIAAHVDLYRDLA